MRRTSRGILAINIALALSYCPRSRITNAILFGLSPSQAAFVLHQVKELAEVAHHPAFLPTLVCGYHRSLLRRLYDQANADLFDVEVKGGQSGAPPPPGDWYPTQKLSNHKDVNVKALGVIQVSTAWEGYTKAMLADAANIQQFIAQVDSLFSARGVGGLLMESRILFERLQFLARKGEIMLWRLQYITKRAQAHQAAVRTDRTLNSRQLFWH